MAGGGVDGISIGPGLLVSDGSGTEIYITSRAPTARTRHVRLEPGAALLLEAADSNDTVWEVSRDVQSPEHPTQKPVELARRAIENSSLPHEIVLDPFLGSGTTLIGAEVTGRACYGTELDPAYVDIIVGRWERFTGQKAQRQK